MTSPPAPVAVLVISQLPPPVHGSTVMTRTFLDAVIATGRTVRLVDRRFSRRVEQVGRGGISKVLRAPFLALRLAGALASRPAVCVLFLTNRPGSFLVDVVLILLIAARRVPLVLYVHTSGYRALAGRGRVWRTLVRLAFQSASRVVVLGDRLRADVLAFAGAARLTAISNATAAPPAHAGGRSDGTLLFLSNLLPEKGAEVFVRTAARLAEQDPQRDWRFLVAGAGDDEQRRRVERAAEAGRIEHRVRLIGRVDAAERDALFAESALLVFPSVYPLEAQPLTIVEAFAAGVPVVAYDTGGVGDLVVDGVTGALVPAGDEAGLQRAVHELLADPERLATLSASARRRFEARHSLTAYRAAWDALLTEESR